MNKSILAIALVSLNLQAHALGFSVDVGNLFGELVTQSGTQSSGGSVDQVLKHLSADMNQKMPMDIDATTRLDKVSTEPGKHFIYHYTKLDEPAAAGEKAAYSSASKSPLKSDMCTSPEAQKFLKNGVSVTYQYQDKYGHDLGSTEVTPGDCGYKS